MSIFGLSGPSPDPRPSASDSQNDSLQFERAEFTAPSAGLTCSNCSGSASPEYHEFKGKVFCSTCRSNIEQSLTRMRESGSVPRAILYGLGAAVLGSVIFYAISALTGFQFGLIAVLVGWAVGKAVRKGSGSLGGRKYQVIAVLLTYFSIASTGVPPITKYLFEQGSKAKAARSANPETVPPKVHMNPVVALALLVAIVFGLALAAPLFTVFQNPLGIIIIGIGLWEAWKFTRAVKVEFTGPFTVAAAPSPGGA